MTLQKTHAGMALWLFTSMLLAFGSPWLDLPNMAVMLVLAAVLSSVCWPLGLTLVSSAASVIALNYFYVPPIHTFTVDLRQHAVLLVTITAVTWLISILLKRQQLLADKEHQQSLRSAELVDWQTFLRDTSSREAIAARLADWLKAHQLVDAVTVFTESYDADPPVQSAQLREGIKTALRYQQALGPGTGRYEDNDTCFVPLRGQQQAFGVLCLPQASSLRGAPLLLNHIQAVCDHIGLWLDRSASARRESAAAEAAQLQQIRSTFLSSIAHDQRTPLASIMSAASTIQNNFQELSADATLSLVDIIYREAMQISRLTDNTLSLARLSGPGVQIQMQYESVEDILGSVFQRLRHNEAGARPAMRCDPDLPLLPCNAVLVEQVLMNLLDNAFKHSGAPDTVEVTVFASDGDIVLQVADRGRGMASPAVASTDSLPADAARGLGIGLQLCHTAVASHGGTLAFRPNTPQGLLVEVRLPATAKGAHAVQVTGTTP